MYLSVNNRYLFENGGSSQNFLTWIKVYNMEQYRKLLKSESRKDQQVHPAQEVQEYFQMSPAI